MIGRISHVSLPHQRARARYRISLLKKFLAASLITLSARASKMTKCDKTTRWKIISTFISREFELLEFIYYCNRWRLYRSSCVGNIPLPSSLHAFYSLIRTRRISTEVHHEGGKSNTQIRHDGSTIWPLSASWSRLGAPKNVAGRHLTSFI